MQKLTLVIGATATGKTHFIENNYRNKNVDIFNVYDYQQRVYDEAGFGDTIPFGAQYRCLYEANKILLKDIIERLLMGQDVVVEHTLYKAKRRIAYIDEIRKVADVHIEVFVMNPGDLLWESNLQKRNLSDGIEYYKAMSDAIEFPNVAEGIDTIYEVVDGNINLRMNPPKTEILAIARDELMKESKRIQEEDEEKRKRTELLASMTVRPFWHYCEVCGKKEFITAETAFNDGWDYPPDMGVFGVLGPRTCGNCTIENTLYWKINTNGSIPIVIREKLSPAELVTLRRIEAEPESLLTEE